MKNIFTVLLIFSIYISHAHPSLTDHTHESAFAAYGWMILPIVFIFGIGLYYLNKEKTRSF